MSKLRCGLVLMGCLLVLQGCGGDGGAAPREVQIDVDVQGGEVVGGVQRYEVPLDATVALTVEVDADDHLHVHGYEDSVTVTAGEPATLLFTADQPGVFTAHLHLSDAVIAELAIS